MRGHRTECGIAALDFIADREDSDGYQAIEYLHYSFYEWLVAAHVRDHIIITTAAAEDIARVVKYDLPREMRHYLTTQLSSAQHEFTDQLIDAYRSLRNGRSAPREILVAGNLIIYLIARLSINARKLLERIEAEEREPFLANALLWSLCHLASPAALSTFVSRYFQDQNWSEISRGYVLYYYGDLNRSMGPPYRDAEPYISADRSIARVFSMLASEKYSADVALERQFVDTITILDIMSCRTQRLSSSQVDCLQPIIDRLRAKFAGTAAHLLLDNTFDKVSMKGSLGA